MGLLANGFRDKSGVYQTFGATASNNAYPSAHHGNYHRTGARRNLTAGEGITSDLVGIPSGNLHPNSWMMPQKAGLIASRNSILGEGTIVGAPAGGVNGIATLSGSGDLSGVGALIISMVAALTGSGTISNAAADAYLQLAAALSGTSTLAGLASALAHAAAALSGEGTVAATSAATALGELAANLTVTGATLTTGNVASAVWDAIASANNELGSMGEQLNNAGAGGNPWDTVIESGYTADEVLRILLAVSAGKTTVTDLGGGAATVVFRDQGDTKDRVSVDMQDSDRETVTLDPS